MNFFLVVLGMVDYLVLVFPQDTPLLNKTFGFLGDLQTYLLRCIHQY